MDNKSLDDLLQDGRNRGFWLKPIGPPKDHPDWDKEDHRTWEERVVEIHFSKTPAKVAVGDVLIGYRVRYVKLIYVAERLPIAEWGPMEVRSEYNRQRWPYYIKARNLTPGYGNVWKQFSIQPFALAKEYNALHPEEPARLGAVLRGNDKASIPREFAEILIRRVRDIPER